MSTMPGPTDDLSVPISDQPSWHNETKDACHTSKDPKSRPPSGLREKILRNPLPRYSGPYSVGWMDIEVPVREPRVFSHIKRQHRHLLQLETVLFSVFYPSAIGSGQGSSPEGEKEWSRATWLPRPRIDIAKGYARFAGLPKWPTVAWFGLFSYTLVTYLFTGYRYHYGFHEATCLEERAYCNALAAKP